MQQTYVSAVAIDPGITTGYCIAQFPTEGGLLEYHPFQQQDDVDDLWRRLRELEPRYIIIEDFEFRAGRQRAGLVLFSVQMIGVARLYSLVCSHQCGIYVQKAAQGKSYYTDAALKREKLYQRGIPHAMDASRHLLQWWSFGAGYQFNNGKQEYAKIVEKGFFSK